MPLFWYPDQDSLLRASKEVGWPVVTGYASLEEGVPGDHWSQSNRIFHLREPG